MIRSAQIWKVNRMDDFISRQAAIEALDFEIVHMTAYCDGKNEGNPLAQYNKGLEDGKKAIEALPSAQPQRKTGRWKVSELPKGKMKYCSECGFGQYIADERQYNFCPNCGARMDEEMESNHE